MTVRCAPLALSREAKDLGEKLDYPLVICGFSLVNHPLRVFG